jgi:hypothetical protein
MKTYINTIESIEKTGKSFRLNNGQVCSTVNVTTVDGITSEVARKNQQGGLICGSNYAGDKKALAVAIAVKSGESLEEAVFANYAKHGFRDGYVWGSEYMYRLNGDMIERKSFRSAHQTNGWEPVWNLKNKLPQAVAVKKASTKRMSGKAYQTEGVDTSRNASISEAKRKGLLKA